jgi:hypothetical protein
VGQKRQGEIIALAWGFGRFGSVPPAGFEPATPGLGNRSRSVL